MPAGRAIPKVTPNRKDMRLWGEKGRPIWSYPNLPSNAPRERHTSGPVAVRDKFRFKYRVKVSKEVRSMFKDVGKPVYVHNVQYAKPWFGNVPEKDDEYMEIKADEFD
jgi:hypothetical protein